MSDFIIISGAFEHGASIPSVHTCQGNDSSPPLSWSGAPIGTKSFALIVDDPDAPDPLAPKMTWVHWLVYNIPASISSLSEKQPAGTKLANGALVGKNDSKKTAYGGPCPPIGQHRYFFKLYALSALLEIPSGATKAELEKAMAGKILGMATLVGFYKKK